MKIFKVTVYPITPWSIRVEANSEQKAKELALSFEGPCVPSYLGDTLDEWAHDIIEWPNIGNGTVDVEKD